MSDWIRDLGDVLKDDTHILLSREQYRRLGAYQNAVQATNPSVGRVYRTGDNCHECRRLGDPTLHPHMVVEIEPDPEPGWVIRRSRVPLFVDEVADA